MFRFLKRFFKRSKQNIVAHQPRPEERSYYWDNLPPGFVPIDSLYDLREIPGTTLTIGSVAKVFNTPDNEQVTHDFKKGTRLGCGHSIFTINQMVTPECTEIGLGGQCLDCSLEAAELYNKNLVSLQIAEAMSLFCSQCASHCDGCRRTNICLRHSQQFKDLDGRVILLCPDCLKKADKEKFFKKTLSIMLAPFVDYKRLPPSQRRDYYDY